MPGLSLFINEFGKPEMETDAKPSGLVEKWLSRIIGHFPLEPSVQFVLGFDIPVRKKRGQRALGEDHQVAPFRVRLTHHDQQAFDSVRAGFPSVDRAGLRCADGNYSCHSGVPIVGRFVRYGGSKRASSSSVGSWIMHSAGRPQQR